MSTIISATEVRAGMRVLAIMFTDGNAEPVNLECFDKRWGRYPKVVHANYRPDGENGQPTVYLRLNDNDPDEGVYCLRPNDTVTVRGYRLHASNTPMVHVIDVEPEPAAEDYLHDIAGDVEEIRDLAREQRDALDALVSAVEANTAAVNAQTELVRDRLTLIADTISLMGVRS